MNHHHQHFVCLTVCICLHLDFGHLIDIAYNCICILLSEYLIHSKFPVNFRLLVYEYVNNGNLEQWLHGAMRQYGFLTWDARIKILLGTAKAYDYLVHVLFFFFKKNSFFVFSEFPFTDLYDYLAGWLTCMRQLSQKLCIEILSLVIF